MAREKVFRFKQFSVRHEKSAMKVGTDGVLLGAWTNAECAGTVLDIGAGTGLIALMLAQRSKAKITAIEIDDDAAEEANENFTLSPWGDRLSVVKSDFVDFAESCEKKFDVIVSNPPYFVDSLECPDEKRGKARHTSSLSFENLIYGAVKLLAESGHIYLVTPIEVEAKLDSIIADNECSVTHKVYVCSVVGGEPKRVLWEIAKGVNECECSRLEIEKERHIYTDDYISLTREYYLKM